MIKFKKTLWWGVLMNMDPKTAWEKAPGTSGRAKNLKRNPAETFHKYYILYE